MTKSFELINPIFRILCNNENKFTIRKNIEFVVQNSLCHGCGTCEAVCPFDAVHISYEEKRGIYIPIVDDSLCTGCELCIKVCPGYRINLTNRTQDQKGNLTHPLIGRYQQIFRSYTNDTQRRSRAASGGMATEIIDYLFSSGKISGAIVTRMSLENPLQAEGYIAYSSQDLIASQKSKYCPVPLNIILKPFVKKRNMNTFAFVGLPHHVHGLRLLQRLYTHMRDSFPYVISLFTSHVPSQQATEFILYKNNISKNNIKKIEYRGGGIPGRMKIQTKDGNEFLVPHLHWTYFGHTFKYFFYPAREWIAFDKLSEWADFSIGDNWQKWISDQLGASTVIARNRKSNSIIEEMVSSDRVTVTKMTAEELVKDQDLEIKLNVGNRLKLWKTFGRKTPIYERKIKTSSSRIFDDFRSMIYVMLCEHKVNFSVMDQIIKIDYYFWGIPVTFFRRFIKYVNLAINIFRMEKTDKPRKNTKYKVILIGGYGYADIGDEAMPHAIRVNLRKKVGNHLEIMMLSPYPELTQLLHGENSNNDFTYISHDSGASLIRKLFSFFMTIILFGGTVLEKHGIRLHLWQSARRALDEIISADAILNVGGGNINSVIPSEMYKKCTTYIIASILNKPVFLSGQTMGPFHGIIGQTYARLALNKVKSISFRDKNTSMNRLKNIGVFRPVMFDAADDAITLEGISRRNAEKILRKETNLSFKHLNCNLLIAMNLKASLGIFKGQGRSNNLTNEIELMAMVADRAIEFYSCRIVFIATDFSHGVDDRVLHQEIYRRMHHKESAYIIKNTYIDDELIGMIGCFDVAIGARYHFNVFAASRNIPFLGIASGTYQRTKLEGLANLCGLKDCYVDRDMEFATVDEVWPYFKNVIENREDIQKSLVNRIPSLKKRSLYIVDEVANYLKTNINLNS